MARTSTVMGGTRGVASGDCTRGPLLSCAAAPPTRTPALALTQSRCGSVCTSTIGMCVTAAHSTIGEGCGGDVMRACPSSWSVSGAIPMTERVFIFSCGGSRRIIGSVDGFASGATTFCAKHEHREVTLHHQIFCEAIAPSFAP